MSLFKQLGIGFSCVVFMMFIATLWVNTANTSTFIANQLSTQAQDTATSLGQAISPHLGNIRDIIVVETITNEVFDRGSYSSLTLSDHDGNIIINRTSLINSESVPGWFMSIFTIDAPSGISEIKDDWVVKGRVVVQSNAGLAYQHLWSNALSSFWITLLVLVVAVGFAWALVEFIISRPINKVIAQTESIGMHDFRLVQDMPKTTELGKFVVALNTMSSKLSDYFSRLSEQSEHYRLTAYADPVTHAGNRRAFEIDLEQMFKSDSANTSGHLLVVRASSLGQVQKLYGGEIGDKYLKDICETIRNVLGQYFDDFAVYRINGADFAVIVEHTKTAQIVALTKTLASTFKRMEKTEYSEGTAHIGISSFAVNQDIARLLEQTDNALSVAIDNDEGWELSDNLPVTFSNTIWRDKIKAVLQNGYSDFVTQPIMDQDQNIAYSEWYARLPNEENSANLPMTQLIPASIRLDHAQKLDKLIITNLLKRLHLCDTKIGVNLSRQSIFDTDFMDWFMHELQVIGDQSKQLVIEISERTLVNNIDELLVQTNRLKASGVEIAVEHFGGQLASVVHLNKLAPHYLKIDGRFTKNIHAQMDNQLFVASLINIAQGLNIKVIAEMVETKAEKEWLMAAQIDYFQGYFIATPKLVDSENTQAYVNNGQSPVRSEYSKPSMNKGHSPARNDYSQPRMNGGHSPARNDYSQPRMNGGQEPMHSEPQYAQVKGGQSQQRRDDAQAPFPKSYM